MKNEFDKEEMEYFAEIENDEWVSAKNKKKIIADLEKAAHAMLTKNKRMNIRMNERDIELLKAKALEEGLPYQTLVSSILHKYVTGKLKEVG